MEMIVLNTTVILEFFNFLRWRENSGRKGDD